MMSLIHRSGMHGGDRGGDHAGDVAAQSSGEEPDDHDEHEPAQNVAAMR